jgi:hypothetical protein
MEAELMRAIRRRRRHPSTREIVVQAQALVDRAIKRTTTCGGKTYENVSERTFEQLRAALRGKAQQRSNRPMKITTVTVSYGQTQSLPEYSNVKPSITLTAEVEEGEDREQVKAQLKAEAQAFVHEAIDEALEADGRPAKYSSEPRYKVQRTTNYHDYERPRGSQVVEAPEQLVIILPQGLKLAESRFLTDIYGAASGLRLAHAKHSAAEFIHERDGYTLLDASDGDLSKLPAWLTTPPAPKSEAPAEAEQPQEPAF